MTTLLWGLVLLFGNLIKKYIKNQKKQKFIQKKLQSFTLQQIQKQIDSKKYLPGSHIEVNQVKENLRYFCYPNLFYKKLIDLVNHLDFSYINYKLAEKYGKGKKISIRKTRKSLICSLNGCIKIVYKIKNSLNQNIQMLNQISADYNTNWLAKRKLDEAIEKVNLLESRILLILDDAGQGKTNLICDLTREFLLNLKIPVALFFGADFYELNNKNIKAVVAENITDNADFYTLNKFIENECKKNKCIFVIIIDALNESSYENFTNAVNEFIRDTLNNKFVRIILTCRTEYFNINFKMIDESYSSHITRIEGINSKLEEHEKDNLFRKYLSSFNIKWGSFSERVYEKLVSNFLLLRIFCEVYQGQSIGSVVNVYMLDLFQKYYRQVRDSIKENIESNASIEEVVCEVIKQMINTKIYKDIPIQKIIENKPINKNVLLKLIDENIFFRRDITNKSGVLLDKEVISFTFDEIRDYLIADYLINILFVESNKDAIKFIDEEIIPQKPLFEGVSKYLFFFSKKDPNNRQLSSILESADWYSDKYIYYLFETNDDDLTSEDINKVKDYFLSCEDKSEFILKMLVYYRYDPRVYKNLNISILFQILTEMSESERINKFERYFHEDYSYSAYGDSENYINLDHYYNFINDFIENEDSINPAIEFLFFICTCKVDHKVRLKAENILNSIYKKDSKVVLGILEKYQKCNNAYFKDMATSLIKKYKDKKEVFNGNL